MPGGNLQDEQGFRQWLEQHSGLDGRSLSDVVSRAKRAIKVAPIDAVRTENELLYRLNEAREFKAMSGAVKSQVKRAALLYLAFKMSGSRVRR